MLWYGYLFRSDIYFTHTGIVNILHQNVTQHFEFLLSKLSLYYLQTLLTVACLTFIWNQTNTMCKVDCGCISVESENEDGRLHDHGKL
jgi:hypothetical protein